MDVNFSGCIVPHSTLPVRNLTNFYERRRFPLEKCGDNINMQTTAFALRATPRLKALQSSTSCARRKVRQLTSSTFCRKSGGRSPVSPTRGPSSTSQWQQGPSSANTLVHQRLISTTSPSDSNVQLYTNIQSKHYFNHFFARAEALKWHSSVINRFNKQISRLALHHKREFSTTFTHTETTTFLKSRCSVRNFIASSSSHGHNFVGKSVCRSCFSKRRPLSLRSQQGELWKDSPFQSRVFNALGVEKCTHEELHSIFKVLTVDKNEPTPRLYKHEVYTKFHAALDGVIDSDEIDDLVNKFWDYETQPLRANAGVDDDAEIEYITEQEFIARVRELGQSIDRRMMPLAFVFLASGISIGVIIPVMPQLAQILTLSNAQYGSVVGAFAFTKMIGNIPAAMAVERFGCQRVLAGTMLALGGAIGAIGLVDSYEGLIACRLAGGACIAGFVSAAFVYLADISNPLNRGSTMAPPSTAFTAGTALGPALGGALHTFLNLQQTFFAAGGMIFVIGAGTTLFLRSPAVLRPRTDLEKEAEMELAAAQAAKDGTTVIDESKEQDKRSVLGQWQSLLDRPSIASMTGLNFGYWLVLSGVNMTLLPMILVDPTYNLTPVEVGGVFAGISAVGVFVTPIAGRIVDRIGRMETAGPAAVLLAIAMCATTFTTDLPQLLGLLGVWTVAGSVLSVAPTAYISDQASSRDRPQALALLRTAGDVGMLSGSIIAGIIADQTSNIEAIQVNGAAMLGIAAVTGIRFFNIIRAEQTRKSTIK